MCGLTDSIISMTVFHMRETISALVVALAFEVSENRA